MMVSAADWSGKSAPEPESLLIGNILAAPITMSVACCLLVLAAVVATERYSETGGSRNIRFSS
jgi:hypothetical protein